MIDKWAILLGGMAIGTGLSNALWLWAVRKDRSRHEAESSELWDKVATALIVFEGVESCQAEGCECSSAASYALKTIRSGCLYAERIAKQSR